MLAGVLRIAKESIFSSRNNLKVSCVATSSYSETFGFSDAEIRQMAEDFGCPEKIAEIRRWYNGYQFAEQEFKAADSENELAAKAEDALAQIERMDYLAEFRAQGISTAWKYGIAFWGKRT